MPSKSQLDLSTFDGQPLDGLDFCTRVYDCFDDVLGGPDGIKRLRLRPTKLEKRLIEELIPLAHYVQARYREGRRIRVQWLSGSQPYDAVLWSSGSLVDHHFAPESLHVEVTTSIHENAHLARQLLHERGGSFGAKGISLDKERGHIVSRPYVYAGDEAVSDLVVQILERLRSKSAKDYPPGTVLVINCVANSLILEAEWKDAVDRVTKAQLHLAFREVFLLESVMCHSATIYGAT